MLDFVHKTRPISSVSLSGGKFMCTADLMKRNFMQFHSCCKSKLTS